MGYMPYEVGDGLPVKRDIVLGLPTKIFSRIFGINGVCKRGMDLMLTLPTLMFLLPLFGGLALLIKLSDGGPVFYRQRRLGRNGKPFNMLKFRTMREGADTILESYLARTPAAQAEWDRFQKLRHDPRITPFGGFLRRSSIDELPQLINVLKGDMSLVGQRPILPEQRAAYGRHIIHYELARPGLTGLWQVSGRNRLSFARRAALGSEYIANWSLRYDIKLMAMTLPALMSANEAF